MVAISTEVFDVEWKGGNTDYTAYQPVAVFSLKTEEGTWLSENNAYLLRIGRTVYNAGDVMKGEADEHIEKLWSVQDE